LSLGTNSQLEFIGEIKMNNAGVLFEKSTPAPPKNFRVMGAAETCKAKDAGLIIYHIINPAAPTVPCPESKKHRNELAHFCVFCFLGLLPFCYRRLFSKFLWFFPSKERTEKRTLILIFQTAVSPINLSLSGYLYWSCHSEERFCKSII